MAHFRDDGNSKTSLALQTVARSARYFMGASYRRRCIASPVFAIGYAVVFEALAICGEYFIVFYSYISYIIVIESTD